MRGLTRRASQGRARPAVVALQVRALPPACDTSAARRSRRARSGLRTPMPARTVRPPRKAVHAPSIEPPLERRGRRTRSDAVAGGRRVGSPFSRCAPTRRILAAPMSARRRADTDVSGLDSAALHAALRAASRCARRTRRAAVATDRASLRSALRGQRRRARTGSSGSAAAASTRPASRRCASPTSARGRAAQAANFQRPRRAKRDDQLLRTDGAPRAARRRAGPPELDRAVGRHRARPRRRAVERRIDRDVRQRRARRRRRLGLHRGRAAEPIETRGRPRRRHQAAARAAQAVRHAGRGLARSGASLTCRYACGFTTARRRRARVRAAAKRQPHGLELCAWPRRSPAACTRQ